MSGVCVCGSRNASCPCGTFCACDRRWTQSSSRRWDRAGKGGCGRSRCSSSSSGESGGNGGASDDGNGCAGRGACACAFSDSREEVASLSTSVLCGRVFVKGFLRSKHEGRFSRHPPVPAPDEPNIEFSAHLGRLGIGNHSAGEVGRAERGRGFLVVGMLRDDAHFNKPPPSKTRPSRRGSRTG